MSQDQRRSDRNKTDKKEEDDTLPPPLQQIEKLKSKNRLSRDVAHLFYKINVENSSFQVLPTTLGNPYGNRLVASLRFCLCLSLLGTH